MRLRLLVLICLAPCVSWGGDLGVNVYGLSYHLERSRAKELGLTNEVNPGLGLRYRAPLNERFDWFADAGLLRDSARHTALIAGPGVFYKAGENLRLGGAAALFHSKTYNGGGAFIAPVPLAAYEWRAASVSLAYFPRISGRNEVNTLGLWLTLWPQDWRAGIRGGGS
jgi:hypothetical protein